MNTQYKAIWEDFARRKRKAIQSRHLASSMLLVGVVTLVITFAAIFVLAALTNFGDFHYSLGEATIYYATVTIAAGFLGVLFLALGYARQSNANHELWKIEEEKRVVKLQQKSDEENSWPETPAK